MKNQNGVGRVPKEVNVDNAAIQWQSRPFTFPLSSLVSHAPSLSLCCISQLLHVSDNYDLLVLSTILVIHDNTGQLHSVLRDTAYKTFRFKENVSLGYHGMRTNWSPSNLLVSLFCFTQNRFFSLQLPPFLLNLHFPLYYPFLLFFQLFQINSYNRIFWDSVTIDFFCRL